jgi:hypothetical protein
MKGMNLRSRIATPTLAGGIHWIATSRGCTAAQPAADAATDRVPGETRCPGSIVHATQIPAMNDLLRMAVQTSANLAGWIARTQGCFHALIRTIGTAETEAG